jgi:cation transport protein ChaC
MRIDRQDRMADLWVFGYGSLMWRPGFPHSEAQPAMLKGAHRALCIISVHHRGTEERPGLVLGLAQGGACRGVAFAVSPGAEEDTIAYLREREQVTDVYVEAYRTARLLDGSGRVVRALTYVVDPKHPQYAGRLPLEEQERIVRGAEGRSGLNVDYVLKTARHLEDAGVHDAMLSALAARLARNSD